MQDVQNCKRFTLRIGKNIFEAVKRNAIANKRAIGKEIEYTLEQKYIWGTQK